MNRISIVAAAAVAAVALPAFAGTALAEPHRHPGHPGAGPHGHPRPGPHGHPGPSHHGHPGPGHHGHPGPGPHGHPGPGHHGHPGPHPGFGPHPHPAVGPHRVFRNGRYVVVQPYPVGVGGPVYGGPVLPAGRPAAGGCSTRRTASLTPYGWHKVVTVRTCITP